MVPGGSSLLAGLGRYYTGVYTASLFPLLLSAIVWGAWAVRASLAKATNVLRR
jgi:hypothetical protein